MASVVIEPTDEQPVPGNLKAHVRGNKLLLPRKFAFTLEREGVRTAEDLMSYILSFPSSVAETLQWSAADVNSATSKLRKQLRGHISDALLRLQRHPDPPMGAMDPDDLP
jgi:hypothetical protein